MTTLPVSPPALVPSPVASSAPPGLLPVAGRIAAWLRAGRGLAAGRTTARDAAHASVDAALHATATAFLR